MLKNNLNDIKNLNFKAHLKIEVSSHFQNRNLKNILKSMFKGHLNIEFKGILNIVI